MVFKAQTLPKENGGKQIRIYIRHLYRAYPLYYYNYFYQCFDEDICEQ